MVFVIEIHAWLSRELQFYERFSDNVAENREMMSQVPLGPSRLVLELRKENPARTGERSEIELSWNWGNGAGEGGG